LLVFLEWKQNFLQCWFCEVVGLFHRDKCPVVEGFLHGFLLNVTLKRTVELVFQLIVRITMRWWKWRRNLGLSTQWKMKISIIKSQQCEHFCGKLKFIQNIKYIHKKFLFQINYLLKNTVSFCLKKLKGKSVGT
jgi:hypothetical protein